MSNLPKDTDDWSIPLPIFAVIVAIFSFIDWVKGRLPK